MKSADIVSTTKGASVVLEDSTTHFQDRMDDLYELVRQCRDGCGAFNSLYKSDEMINWIAAKREAYGHVLDDIKFRGGMPRAERRKQREQSGRQQSNGNFNNY